MKFRKKPVVVEAMLYQYPPSKELVEWMGGAYGGLQKVGHTLSVSEMFVKTLEDGFNNEVKHIATEGDWIIKGVNGEFYPCKPDIFEKTYEIAEGE